MVAKPIIHSSAKSRIVCETALDTGNFFVGQPVELVDNPVNYSVGNGDCSLNFSAFGF